MKLLAPLMALVCLSTIVPTVVSLNDQGCEIPYRVLKYCRQKYRTAVGCYSFKNDANERCETYRNFTAMLHGLPAHIHQLRLDRPCRASKMVDGMFGRFKELRRLSLTLCSMTTNITHRVFAGIEHLNELELEIYFANTKIIFEENAFSGLQQLKHLKIVPHSHVKKGPRVLNVESMLMNLRKLESITVSTQYMQTLDFQNLPPMPTVRLLNLSNNDMKEIPHLSSFPNLETLVLNCNKMDHIKIPDKPPVKLRELHVDLQKNRNRKSLNIEQNDFTTYQGIRKLSLDLSQSLVKINKNAFHFFSKTQNVTLTKLKIGGYQTKALKYGSMANLLSDLANASIYNLHLWGSAIPELSDNLLKLFTIPKLKKLSLTDCEVPTLKNGAFKGLPNLEQLDLNNAGIGEIEGAALRNLFKLEQLTLSNNYLKKSMKSVFRYLEDHRSPLKRLYMRNVFGWGEKQREIIFTLNAKKLKELDISDNTLPGWAHIQITNTMGLRTLHIDNFACTGKTCLSFNITSELRILTISKCPSCMANIERQAREQGILRLPQLGYLNMSRNNLRNFDFEKLQLEKLNVLNVSHAQVSDIPQLSKMKRLMCVYLMNNNISEIKEDSFSSLTYLHVVNLQNNNIAFIPGKTFSDLQYLTTLRLKGNPLNCNCQLRPFRDWLQSKYNHVNVAFVGNCSSPDYLVTTGVEHYKLNWIRCDGHMLMVELPAIAILLIATVIVIALVCKYSKRRKYQRIVNVN